MADEIRTERHPRRRDWTWPDGVDVFEGVIAAVMIGIVVTILMIIVVAVVQALGWWVVMVPVAICVLACIGWVVAFFTYNLPLPPYKEE